MYALFQFSFLELIEPELIRDGLRTGRGTKIMQNLGLGQGRGQNFRKTGTGDRDGDTDLENRGPGTGTGTQIWKIGDRGLKN